MSQPITPPPLDDRFSVATLHELTANVPGVVYRCLLDARWTMLFVSDGVEELTGRPASAFIGNTELAFADVIAPEDAAEVERAVHTAIEADAPWSVRYRVVRPDDSRRWVEERGRAVRAADGQVQHLDGAILDVTDRVEAEHALERARADLQAKNEELEAALEELRGARSRESALFDAMNELLPGSVLAGRYRIESQLGEGGMGVVYRATQIGLGRSVAIKLLRPVGRGRADERLRRRFEREARATCAVTHPNAVVVHDAGVTEGGLVYLVMELLEGHAVTEELDREGRLPYARALEIATTVADVLAAAHASGIVHRDIKPDNVFVARLGDCETVKVLDFGLAKLLDGVDTQVTITERGQLVGTPDYMSPERLSQAETIGGAADVYSLGVMLFEMLTGRMPYDLPGTSHAYVVAAHLFQEPRRPSDLVPSLAPELDRLVLSCLAKDPAERPSAAVLARALEGLR
ncbi:MAG: protein kinase [Sandaracinus sp.]|nr:protein kinase [Sandaracinus sp.]